jgi:hypothetical protein
MPHANTNKEEVMTSRKFISLIAILTLSALYACGGGSDGGADPNAPAAVSLAASKIVALANSSDAVTVNATVTKADGTPVADGTVVTFSAPGSAGALSATTAVCTGGLASVTLTHPSISVDNVSVVVTAESGGVLGAKNVKFINQPVSVEVSIAINQTVAGVALLEFNLKNTPGATFNTADPQRIFAIGDASGSLVTGNFLATANSTTIGLVNPTGFNPGVGTPIIRATYAIAAGSGMPSFSIDETTPIIAKDPQRTAIAPQLTGADMVITTVFDTEL